jgi:hypothetical protein
VAVSIDLTIAAANLLAMTATFRKHLLETFAFLTDAGLSLEIETVLRLAGPFVPLRSGILPRCVQPANPLPSFGRFDGRSLRILLRGVPACPSLARRSRRRSDIESERVNPVAHPISSKRLPTSPMYSPGTGESKA